MMASVLSPMRGYLENNRSDRHGKFNYSTHVSGFDIKALHHEFAQYRECFGLQMEERK